MQHEVTIRFTTVEDIDDAELIARELAERIPAAVHEAHVLISARAGSP
jgi:hypothetical protein